MEVGELLTIFICREFEVEHGIPIEPAITKAGADLRKHIIELLSPDNPLATASVPFGQSID